MSRNLNIAQSFLTEHLERGVGDRVALRTDDGAITYAAVDARASAYAHALADAGVEREDRVFIALDDGLDFVGAFFGVLKLGAVVVMINPALDSERISEMVDHCDPRAVVTDGRRAEPYSDRNLAVVEPTAAVDETSFAVVATDEFDPAIWLFSGGTTGVPKAVVQTHRSYLNSTERYAQATLAYGPDDITIAIPKLYFGYATGSNLLFPFSVGGSAVLFPEHPTPELLFRQIERHRPTILINVPTMIAKMVNHPEAATADLSSLRLATSAGEALPAELYRAWKEAFGVELLDGLGTAEMWHVFITNREGDVKPGTIGKPVDGFDVKVCDPDGAPVEHGEVGSLWVNGDSRALGYWRDPARTEETFRGDWVVTGDLVRQDEDGYFEHHGRADDRLKVSGKWLAPQEVESCLLEHDAVDQAVVVGVPNEEGLIKPVAFVIPAGEPPDGLDRRLMEWALERLEPYKHPRAVHIVEAFPATHLGKVDRTALKEAARRVQDEPDSADQG